MKKYYYYKQKKNTWNHMCRFCKQLLYYFLGLFATLYHGMKICEFIICQWTKQIYVCTTRCNMLLHFFQINTVIKAQNYSTVGYFFELCSIRLLWRVFIFTFLKYDWLKTYLVFRYQICSDLLWEKCFMVIKKIFWIWNH